MTQKKRMHIRAESDLHLMILWSDVIIHWNLLRILKEIWPVCSTYHTFEDEYFYWTIYSQVTLTSTTDKFSPQKLMESDDGGMRNNFPLENWMEFVDKCHYIQGTSNSIKKHRGRRNLKEIPNDQSPLLSKVKHTFVVVVYMLYCCV